MEVGLRMKVLFRVDANHETGIGHLVEALTLAGALRARAGAAVSFLTRDARVATDLIGAAGHGLWTIDQAMDEAAEIDLLGQTADRHGFGVIVIDLRDKSADYYAEVNSRVRGLVVILDSTKMEAVPGDIVVNFSIAQDRGFYEALAPSETQYLIGPRYMPMDNAFIEDLRKEKAVSGEVKTILVTQGGSDPAGLSAKIIHALTTPPLDARLVAVIGPAVSEQHREELRGISISRNLRLRWNVSQSEMLRLMALSDLAVTAAGNTLYELAALGTPCAIVCHHEEHQAVAREFEKRKAAINLGIGTRISETVIADAVRTVLSDPAKQAELSKNARRIADGKGTDRIVDAIVARFGKDA